MWAWKAGEKWLREKDPGTIQENTFGTDRFKELFGAIEAKAHPNEPSAYLAGMRAEENPGRSLGLTSVATYQEVTWAKCLDKAKDPAKRIHFTFYPIYDWSYTDVWKFIHESGAPYCKLYDYMYQYGIPVREMRVSSLTHETAVKTMFFMQEIEPDTWNRLVQRLAGVNTISHLREDTTAAPKELPYMFETWTEYRDHLLDNLVLNPEHRERMRTKYARIAHMYRPEVLDGFVQMTITSILTNDFEFTKMDNWIATHINDRKYRNHNTECPECNGKGDPA
jgi:predicted phosphoadenosine phosphosulfate sulfurtransferase